MRCASREQAQARRQARVNRKTVERCFRRRHVSTRISSMTTIIFIRHAQIGTQRFEFGQECPPNSLPREVIDRWLDSKRLAELEDRRSLYRLLHRFSGAAEQEQLTQQEKATLCLHSVDKS